MKNNRKPYSVFSQQNPYSQPYDVARHGTITICHFKKKHRDEMWEHKGVGNVCSKNPEDQGAVGVERYGCPDQTNHHHCDTNHPLHFIVWSLGTWSHRKGDASLFIHVPVLSKMDLCDLLTPRDTHWALFYIQCEAAPSSMRMSLLVSNWCSYCFLVSMLFE